MQQKGGKKKKGKFSSRFLFSSSSLSQTWPVVKSTPLMPGCQTERFSQQGNVHRSRREYSINLLKELFPEWLAEMSLNCLENRAQDLGGAGGDGPGCRKKGGSERSKCSFQPGSRAGTSDPGLGKGPNPRLCIQESWENSEGTSWDGKHGPLGGFSFPSRILSLSQASGKDSPFSKSQRLSHKRLKTPFWKELPSTEAWCCHEGINGNILAREEKFWL